MIQERAETGEPESALVDIRTEFCARLNGTGRRFPTPRAKHLGARLRRLRRGLNEKSDFLRAWIKGLHDHAGNDEEARRNLEILLTRLEEQRVWRSEELQSLLGLRQGGTLPSLVGFSLMRVSKNYKEIYYADILSSILPNATIDFIKSSVSVPRAENNIEDSWSGSVGRAIAGGKHYVPNSFSDPDGVVASEDLIGGNVSIFMRSVYKDESYYKQPDPKKPNSKQKSTDVIAVVFCFLPLAGIFEEADLQLFSDAVDSRAYSIRSYCEHKDAYGNKQRLMRLMQQDHDAASQQSRTERDFLRTLVTPDTQNNPVGAILGVYCQIEGEIALVKSVAVCEGFVERQEWFPEFLEKAPQISDETKLHLAFAKDGKTWGNFALFLREPISVPKPLLLVPGPVLSPLETLWKNFEGPCGDEVVPSPKAAVLSRHEEQIKIAGDMMLGLMGQILNFLALSLSKKEDETDEKQNQIKGNIKQVLALALAYFGAQSWSIPDCLNSLDDWTEKLRAVIGNGFVLLAGAVSSVEDLPIDVHARKHWQSSATFARINSDNWDQWLGDLFGVYDAQIPVDEVIKNSDCFATYLSEFSKSFVEHLNVQMQLPVRLTAGTNQELQGVFRLCSVEPLIGYEGTQDPKDLDDHSKHNPIVSLVASYYSSILLESEKAKADQDVILAQYARGASHGLKNALEVPHLVLERPVLEAERLLRTLEGSLPGRDYIKIQRLLEASSFVLEEVQHLKKQAELFFWVMDPKKARERIEERAKSLESTRLSEVLEKAFLRGLYLTVRTRLSDDVVEAAMINGEDATAQSVGNSFKRAISQSLIDANNGYISDAINHVKTNIAQRTCIDFSISGLIDELRVDGITILLLDAVLMELSQNATKAAFLSVPDVLRADHRPFVKLEVSKETNFVAINISNSTNDSDRDQLMRANQAAQPQRNGNTGRVGGGIQGIWQVRLLCDQLSQDLELDENPVIDGNSVCFTLRWFHGLRR